MSQKSPVSTPIWVDRLGATEPKRFELPSVIAAELERSLSDEIIFLRLEPGSRVTEEDLCSRYGVSRSPVREALKMLEADGLIVRSARRGVRITPVSASDLEEVYSCRAALEGLAAAGAAKNAGPDTHAELRQLIRALDDAIAARDVTAFFQNNVALTRAVHLNSGNNTLIRILNGIEKQALRYRYLAHTRTHEMLETSLAGHRGVCDAIIAGNAALARRRADRMIRIAHSVIAKVLAEASQDGSGSDAVPKPSSRLTSTGDGPAPSDVIRPGADGPIVEGRAAPKRIASSPIR